MLFLLFLVVVTGARAECHPDDAQIVDSVNTLAVAVNTVVDSVLTVSGKPQPKPDQIVPPVQWRVTDLPNEQGYCIGVPTGMDMFRIKLQSVLETLHTDRTQLAKRIQSSKLLSSEMMAVNEIDETNRDIKFIRKMGRQYKLPEPPRSCMPLLFASTAIQLTNTLNQHYDIVLNSTVNFFTMADAVSKLLLPPKMATDYRIVDAVERTLLDTRDSVTVFTTDLPDKIADRLGRGNRTWLDSIRRGMARLPIVNVPLEMSKRLERWPSYSSPLFLQFLIGDTNTNASAPLCPTLALDETGFTVTRVGRAKLMASFGAYRDLLHIAGFEQLRFYCQDETTGEFLVVTQRNTHNVPLEWMIQVSDDADQSILTKHWQTVLAIRVRQNLGILEMFGWTHVRPVYEFNFATQGGFPTLINLFDCVSVNTTRQLSQQKDMSIVDDDGRPAAVQIGLFFENTPRWSKLIESDASRALLAHTVRSMKHSRASK